MTKCNPVTNCRKRSGRHRHQIDYNDFVKPPNQTMLMLAELKNSDHSWRTLADELNDRMDGQVSHTLVRRVALGQCNSDRIDHALGIRPEPPPITVTPCAECGKLHKQVKMCQPRPKAIKRRLAFWLADDEFEAIRAIADSHPGGRVAWLKELIGGVYHDLEANMD